MTITIGDYLPLLSATTKDLSIKKQKSFLIVIRDVIIKICEFNKKPVPKFLLKGIILFKKEDA
jgi:hypothetical protein